MEPEIELQFSSQFSSQTSSGAESQMAQLCVKRPNFVVLLQVEVGIGKVVTFLVALWTLIMAFWMIGDQVSDALQNVKYKVLLLKVLGTIVSTNTSV